VGTHWVGIKSENPTPWVPIAQRTPYHTAAPRRPLHGHLLLPPQGCTHSFISVFFASFRTILRLGVYFSRCHSLKVCVIFYIYSVWCRICMCLRDVYRRSFNRDEGGMLEARTLRVLRNYKSVANLGRTEKLLCACKTTFEWLSSSSWECRVPIVRIISSTLVSNTFSKSCVRTKGSA